MGLRHWTVAGALLLLIVLAIAGFLATRDTGSASTKTTASAVAQSPLVDDRPLKTARALALLAATPDEQRLAQEAAHVADHEVDLAFADALREASEHPDGQDPKNRELYLRNQQAQATLTEEKAHLEQLKAKLPAASASEKESIQEQIDLFEAQQALDEDELEDARQDLIRAGGDREGAVQRLREEHEAAEQAFDKAPTTAPVVPVDLAANNLASQVRAWIWLKDKSSKLEAARNEAQALGKNLLGEHDALERHVREEDAQKQDAKQQATGLRKTAAQGVGSKAAAAAAVSSLKHFSDDQKLLSGLDRQIQDEQELQDLYGNWMGLVENQQRAIVHGMLRSVLWILLIVLLVYLGSQLADRFFAEAAPDTKHLFRLRTVVRFGLQAIGLLLVAFVIFGEPSQMPTVLGLAGAGLTVALKDFIVGFFGWFVLMGRNGIRVGDWVEINGVVGEVVEIGLLRTVLLETGNWTDTGHPTGRKVAFVNSFAIEGHFFNFSTVGQWLWDELQVLIPPGENPYHLVDAIRKLVEEETRAGVGVAEKEWQKSTTRYRMQSLSVAPEIHLRPTAAGVEMQVRYIISANERYSMRARLYEKIVGLMHGEAKPQIPAGPSR